MSTTFPSSFSSSFHCFDEGNIRGSPSEAKSSIALQKCNSSVSACMDGSSADFVLQSNDDGGDDSGLGNYLSSDSDLDEENAEGNAEEEQNEGICF